MIAGTHLAREVLAHPDITVRPSTRPVDMIEELRSRMARFSDGPDHDYRRTLVDRRLAEIEPDAVSAQVFRETLKTIAPGDDVMPAARRIPARALAQALGIAPVDAVVDAVIGLADQLAARVDEPSRPDANEVAAAVDHRSPEESTDDDIAAISILFQTVDATASLIAMAAEAMLPRVDSRPIAVDEVAAVMMSHPTVTSTMRRAGRTCDVATKRIQAGDSIRVVLAPDGEGATPFGWGSHACPGRTLALDIATAFVNALTTLDLQIVSPECYEPRPNIRLPCRLFSRSMSTTATA